MNWRVMRAIPAGLLLMGLCAVLAAQTVPSDKVNAGGARGTDNDPAQRPGAAQGHDNMYIIGDDDVLEVFVWKEPELSKSITVRPDGRISMPLVGELSAAGKTPLQLEHDIKDKLLTYMTDPQVVVIVQKINSENFNVMGQVARPGSYPLTVTTTVMDAIAMAGGFKDFAKKKSVRILRGNPNGTESRFTFNYETYIKGKHPQENIRLQPGDTVVVN
ncbi:MAG TPA: polysaccharide biosynthesis/export family protein [Acidobacteriaceae bacterium]|nr:polysaccharide biosynthesis/export family protein [Acidobacteriaceae bacterium]